MNGSEHAFSFTKPVLVLLILVALAQAEFMMERVDVTISDINPDGSARVHESIKFIMYGNYSRAVYDSGISNNELSSWSTNTGLKDVKFHLNPSKVDIRDFRLRPQPRTKCNPIQGTCHGELILDYLAYPTYATNGSQPTTPVPNTGIFTIEKYKPRTERYALNPGSLSFTSTPEGDTILEDNVYLTVILPAGSTILDLNPQPTASPEVDSSAISSTLSSAQSARSVVLSWTDVVLVKFSLVFDLEDSVDKEVSDFFAGFMQNVSRTLSSPQGIALVTLILILICSYLYIIMSKRKGEE